MEDFYSSVRSPGCYDVSIERLSRLEIAIVVFDRSAFNDDLKIDEL